MTAAALVAASAASLVGSNSIASASTGPVWGYALASDETATDYTPALAYQRQSNGLHVMIHRNGTGDYRVTFPGLASSLNGGIVHVTAQGNALQEACQSDGWGTSGSDVIASVLCFNGGGSPYAGTPIDAYYDVVYTVGAGSLALAYAWDDLPTASGNVASFWSFDGKGGTISSSHNATGDYDVTIPHLAGSSGTVKVTPYGSNMALCSVVSWGNHVVHVVCTDELGNPADTAFNLTFVKDLPLTGAGGHRNGYLWNYVSNASYTAGGSYFFDSSGGTVTVTYSPSGSYRVEFGGFALNHGDVQVTAYGSGATMCNSGGAGAGSGFERVDVYCFAAAGPFVADSRFTVQWFM